MKYRYNNNISSAKVLDPEFFFVDKDKIEYFIIDTI